MIIKYLWDQKKISILKCTVTGYTYTAIPDKQVNRPPRNPPMKPPVTGPALLLVCAVVVGSPEAEGDPCVDAGVDTVVDAMADAIHDAIVSANFSLTLLQLAMLLSSRCSRHSLLSSSVASLVRTTMLNSCCNNHSCVRDIILDAVTVPDGEE